MPESQLQLLTATLNRQCVLDGYELNGVQYAVEDSAPGWHITASPGHDPINIYWVAGGKFYAVKIHLITDDVTEIRLEVFDEIFYIQPEEKHAILKAIAAWEAA